MRFAWALLAMSAALLSVPPGTLAEQRDGRTADELAQALQRRYDNIRDFSADFVHRYRGGILRREAVERGALLVKKPGRMRWEYQAPERKLFVSDGTTLYSYLPEDRQVLVSAVPDDSSASTPALFLAGRGSLTRDFDVSLTDVPDGLDPASQALRLVPRAPQADYESLVLSVDPATLALRGLVALDMQGGTSSFTFTNLRENIGLADRQFAFDVPRGVEVIRDTTNAPARTPAR
jgi:outer membrane lipoprotein carrier protein